LAISFKVAPSACWSWAVCASLAVAQVVGGAVQDQLELGSGSGIVLAAKRLGHGVFLRWYEFVHIRMFLLGLSTEYVLPFFPML
jgi:hypothetical protein